MRLHRSCSVSLAVGLVCLLSAVQVFAQEWRHYAGDLAARKYSPLDQITRDNVTDL